MQYKRRLERTPGDLCHWPSPNSLTGEGSESRFNETDKVTVTEWMSLCGVKEATIATLDFMSASLVFPLNAGLVPQSENMHVTLRPE